MKHPREATIVTHDSIFCMPAWIGKSDISRYSYCYMIRRAQEMREFENPDHWDMAAQHYEKTAHPFTARYAEAALERISLEPGSRVLDVAAGTGALALAAARMGAQVLATDFSPGMVARIAAAGLPNVEARAMDGQALALPDGGVRRRLLDLRDHHVPRLAQGASRNGKGYASRRAWRCRDLAGTWRSNLPAAR